MSTIVFCVRLDFPQKLNSLILILRIDHFYFKNVLLLLTAFWDVWSPFLFPSEPRTWCVLKSWFRNRSKTGKSSPISTTWNSSVSVWSAGEITTLTNSRKELQSTPINSYPDNLDLHLIRMYLRPPFREDQSTIIRLIRISPFSYLFIRSPAIRIRRIQLYQFSFAFHFARIIYC